MAGDLLPHTLPADSRFGRWLVAFGLVQRGAPGGVTYSGEQHHELEVQVLEVPLVPPPPRRIRALLRVV